MHFSVYPCLLRLSFYFNFTTNRLILLFQLIFECTRPSHVQSFFHCILSTLNVIFKAIDGALEARDRWESMPFNDRAAIFLKAADLLANKYRYDLLAATMLGQGKNVWWVLVNADFWRQAEIDAAAELIDFWRFNCKYAQEIYQQQPTENSATVWNRVEYRPLVRDFLMLLNLQVLLNSC